MRAAQRQRFADVRLGVELISVGHLRFTAAEARQHSEFRYVDSWLADPRAFALSPDLSLGPTPVFASMGAGGDPRDSLPPVFQDAAPDAWGRMLMERVHGAGLSEFDMLTLTDDATRQGALRFLDGDGRIILAGREPVPTLLQLADLREAAARAERRGEIANDDLRRLAGAGGSLGGARPKANVADGDALWIAKFSSVGDQSPVERIEVATLRLARACGLRAPDARLMLEQTDRPVALIRRFDRRGGQRTRISPHAPRSGGAAPSKGPTPRSPT